MCLTTVDFRKLACDFWPDTCLWYNAGATSWQLVGQGGADRWLEATRSGAQGQEYVLQTAAVFNTTEEKFLVVAYQLSGSDSVAWELQRKSSAGDWQLLLSDSGPHAHGTLWQNASVVVPAGTVGLHLLANVTNELDTVRIDSIVAADLPRNWEDVDITCGFESGFCSWSTTGTQQPWLRLSGPTPSIGTGPETGRWSRRCSSVSAIVSLSTTWL